MSEDIYRAAAEALQHQGLCPAFSGQPDLCDCGSLEQARAVVDAVAPLIAAAIAERIDAERLLRYPPGRAQTTKRFKPHRLVFGAYIWAARCAREYQP